MVASNRSLMGTVRFWRDVFLSAPPVRRTDQKDGRPVAWATMSGLYLEATDPSCEGHPTFGGLIGAWLGPDHADMKEPSQTAQHQRRGSNLLGAFCFIVLIATVVYAALTAQ